MASKKSTNGHNKKRTRTPFLDRFAKRIEKTKLWAEIAAKRFATAPNQDVPDALGAITDSLEAIVEALPKLKNWTPPQRGQAFTVGDKVRFKSVKVEELIAAGFFKKGTLEGEHEVEAISGRKLKLKDVGIFQSLYVTKNAEA